jgi:hypothetical protein
MSVDHLSIGAFGDDVRDLHDRLRSDGYELPPAEMERAFFGPGTHQTLQEWQRANQLAVTGILDTASRGLLGSKAASRLGRQDITPTGNVAAASPGAAAPGARARPAPTPGSSGSSPQPGIQRDGSQVDGDTGATYRVSGRVLSSERPGVGGLRVQVVDRRVGGDVPLAEASTDAAGAYSIDYPIDRVRRDGKLAPDIQVRVFSGETLLGSSEVRYDAQPLEVLDVALPTAATAALPTEYESLTAAIGAQFSGNLRDLKESDQQQDLTYLANKTGWDARTVALAALADQFAADAGPAAIPAPFFYALFRAGLPANQAALYQADATAVSAIWRQAAQQGVIPADMAGEIPAVTERFQRLSADKLLNMPPVAGISSLKALLTASGLSEIGQARFAALYTAHRADLPGFWLAVEGEFGGATAQRLQVDGKLGYLTLNNIPLLNGVHAALARDGHEQIDDLVVLARTGYQRPERWADLLGDDVAVPAQIPGETPELRRANYAEYLAAQVRLSYPTASVAALVASGDLATGVPDRVSAFLTEHQGQFELGMQPVEQYLAQNPEVEAAPEVVAEVKRLQRVYQLTSSDQAMAGLLRRGIDAAYQVIRYDRATFRQAFAGDLGGAEEAERIHDRSVQVHNIVLNLAVGFLTARNAVPLGAAAIEPAAGDGPGQPALRALRSGMAETSAGVIAYGTLEQLFGEMDFCACDHCRSVLSPAAYLVDLLHFIDQAPTEPGKDNPQQVLLERRPDLQHLPLTCENTNIALPYIDVVNETLEYFIANDVQRLSLNGFIGHDTDGAESADLLASPQFVLDRAYTILRGERFPAPLPFHQPLESLRRYFAKFDVPLELAMERLRATDDLERDGRPYGWRDILMESLEISRPDYELLTDSATVPLWRAYGFAAGTSDDAVIANLSDARAFARRLQISYDDLVALLQTRFVNPDVNLVRKLERLGVPFATLKALKDGTITDADFDALLPTGAAALDPAEYGGDVKAWVRDPANYARIMSLILLVDPTGKADVCSFDTLELRHAQPVANPDDTSTRLTAVELMRLLRLIRLWKRTRWTIAQTDAAICALYRTDFQEMTDADIDTLAKLDAGLATVLPRFGVVVRVLRALGLTADRDLLSLLACWAPISTHDPASLYRQLFLDPAVLKQDPVFADNGYGEFLADTAVRLADHAEAVRAACRLTRDEYDRIVAALGYDATTTLNVPNVSAIVRRGYLARKLRISVHELLLLASLTGIDPFATPDPTDPAIMRFITLVQQLRERRMPTSAALYLIWNQDLSGRSAPPQGQITELMRTLRGDFVAIDEQFAATEDPGGDIARARMTLVYGEATADAFFALLDDTIVVDVAYDHPQPSLEAAITTVDARLAYDDFRHRLSHTGLLRSATANALKAVAGVTADFQTAVDALLASSEDALGSFFSRHPELRPLYDTYVASTAPIEQKRAALLAGFRPELSRRRKRQQAIQRLSAESGTDVLLVQAILDPNAPPYPLHADGHADQRALDDVLQVETPGLAVEFFFRDSATGSVDQRGTAATLDYAPTGPDPLPTNPTPGAAISGSWHGQVETPEAGFYNLVVETDTGATVTLALDGQTRRLARNGAIWRNADPLELQAGRPYELALTAENLRQVMRVSWETPRQTRQPIPGRYLYPPQVVAPFTAAYVRLLKTASLAAQLHLTANELVHFATALRYAIGGDGWLNALPVSGDPSTATAVALTAPLQALLVFSRIKAEISPDTESLLDALKDPAAAAASTPGQTGPLFALTGWNRQDLEDVVDHVGTTIAGLDDLDRFRQVQDALALVRSTGIAAAALIVATTNDPTGDTVRDLQGALRARYDTADWRDVVQPINDSLREAQRDALVAYILQQLAGRPDTAHIDTADKLFEYFLMDVEMDPCMQTSRIRHALSSVQLFIERCLMNLEPRVSPASIQAKQWEWMRRYRVWEANRKVFLYPENWLEPELRDDKSPFFREMESELLQGDVTEESVTVAVLNYLAKLEEVARLEPCAFHHVEADPQARRGETTHVIARTAGAHRTYYYRRQEYGYWTPWEQVKLDIEDNPVALYVWRDRLLLFWLRILKQGPVDASQLPITSDTTGPVASLDMATIRKDAKLTVQQSGQVPVQAVLSWSEYYNGKWQAPKTSDPDRPTILAAFPAVGEGAFDRAALTLYVGEHEDSLGVWIGGQGASFFVLFNTHSLPMRWEDDPPFPTIAPGDAARFFVGDPQTLSFQYNNYNTDDEFVRQVLKPDFPFQPVLPVSQPADPWRAPFFMKDRRRVFYVTSGVHPVWVRDYLDVGITAMSGIKLDGMLPSLVLPTPTGLDPRTKLPGRDGPAGPIDGLVDQLPIRQVISEDAFIRLGLNTPRPVLFGDRLIGATGAHPDGRLERR